MEHKRHKSNAAAKLLQKEANAHFVNPSTNKIDLKMLTKYLHEKDEFKNCILEHDMLDDSDFSDNQLIMTTCLPKNAKHKRKVKAGFTSVCNFSRPKHKIKTTMLVVIFTLCRQSSH